ncbi:MAG: ABC transporter permease [Chloroflexi bacterium]|nr:MAG: ABC transporter permease [Chloroflexota bacterium]
MTKAFLSASLSASFLIPHPSFLEVPMRTFDLAFKDIRQVLRDRRSLAFLIIMPIVLTLFFGFAMKNQSQETDPRPLIGVVNRDPDGQLSLVLLDLLNASDTIRAEAVAEAGAAQIDSRVVKGELAAGLVIPQGFSAGLLSGGGPQLGVIINEETPDGETARRGLQTTLTRVAGMAETARISLKAYENQAGPLEAAARAAYLKDAVSRVAQEWKQVSVSVKAYSAENPAGKNDPTAANPYNQYSPGMLVMFVIFGLTSAAMVMVSERKNGAMARLLTTPLTKPELIGGHLLGMFLIIFTQQLILVTFGQLVLKVEYFRQPVATLLVMAALALWVAAFGLLISALVIKEEQVILFAMVGMFAFSALGGAWFSLEMVGKAFATVGHMTPTAWAIDGFQNIIVRGQGLESVLLPVGIILAYSAAFFGVAIWKFRFE